MNHPDAFASLHLQIIQVCWIFGWLPLLFLANGFIHPVSTGHFCLSQAFEPASKISWIKQNTQADFEEKNLCKTTDTNWIFLFNPFDVSSIIFPWFQWSDSLRHVKGTFSASNLFFHFLSETGRRQSCFRRKQKWLLIHGNGSKPSKPYILVNTSWTPFIKDYDCHQPKKNTLGFDP